LNNVALGVRSCNVDFHLHFLIFAVNV
jgi:hypothetical protein